MESFPSYAVHFSTFALFAKTDAMFLFAELEGDADEEQIKVAYRRLAKFYHPDGLCLIL